MPHVRPRVRPTGEHIGRMTNMFSKDEKTLQSMERSHIWADRSLNEHLRLGTDRGQALYGIIHGGFYSNLRVQSARFAAERPFDGFALGGSLGVGPVEMQARHAVDEALQVLPPHKPRHLLGIGDLPSIRSAIPLGLDTFDSAFPTKVARHGMALIDENLPPINVGRAPFTREFSKPIDESCPCSTCKRFSLAYLHHLQKAHEPVLATMLCVHNLTAIHRMMKRLRQDIKDGRM
jgi:queuine tRNA-ribosyltransferase